MKNSKPAFLIFLFRLIPALVFILVFIGSIREIRGIIESIDHHRNMVREMQPLSPASLTRLGKEARDLRGAATTGGSPSPESPAAFPAEDHFAMIRDLLHARDITVERFRTTGKEGTAAEFILKSESVNFLTFLKGAEEFPIPLSYIGIKPMPNSSTLNVTMRFNYVP